MTHMGEAALDLPFPLPHDDAVFITETIVFRLFVKAILHTFQDQSINAFIKTVHITNKHHSATALQNDAYSKPGLLSLAVSGGGNRRVRQ